MKFIALEFNFDGTETYRNVLKHRKTCSYWNNEKHKDCHICLECFGGGLTQFTEDLFRELNLNMNKDFK